MDWHSLTLKIKFSADVHSFTSLIFTSTWKKMSAVSRRRATPIAINRVEKPLIKKSGDQAEKH
jgi:hypothetical protein